MAEAGDLSNQTALAIVGGVVLGLLALSAACWAWLVHRLASGRGPWPDRPERPVPWGGREILLALGVWFGWQILASALVERPAPDEPTPVVTLMKLTAITYTGVIVCLPVLFRFSCGAKLSDLGLKREWIVTDIGLGLLAAGLLTPSVYLIQFAATQIWSSREHPVLTMLVQERSADVIALAMASAVVLAPLAEELIFRGLFQGALERRLLFSSKGFARSRPDASSDLPTALPAGQPEDRWRLEDETKPEASLVEDEPTVAESRSPEEEPTHVEGFVPAEEPTAIEKRPRSFVVEPQFPAGHAPGERDPDGSNSTAESSNPRTRTPTEPGPWSFQSLLSLLGPAALFAAVHFDQWPAPLPLFLLAIGLGLLFRKTKSLVAPITLHAAFNGFSTGILLLLIALGVELNLERVGVEGAGSGPAGAAPATDSSTEEPEALDARRSTPENPETDAPSDPKTSSRADARGPRAFVGTARFGDGFAHRPRGGRHRSDVHETNDRKSNRNGFGIETETDQEGRRRWRKSPASGSESDRGRIMAHRRPNRAMNAIGQARGSEIEGRAS